MPKLEAPVDVEVTRLPDVLADYDLDALRRLANPRNVLRVPTDRQYQCDKCGRWVTISTDGETEYGHEPARRGEPACPKRPDSVDTECGRA